MRIFFLIMTLSLFLSSCLGSDSNSDRSDEESISNSDRPEDESEGIPGYLTGPEDLTFYERSDGSAGIHGKPGSIIAGTNTLSELGLVMLKLPSDITLPTDPAEINDFLKQNTFDFIVVAITASVFEDGSFYIDLPAYPDYYFALMPVSRNSLPSVGDLIEAQNLRSDSNPSQKSSLLIDQESTQVAKQSVLLGVVSGIDDGVRNDSLVSSPNISWNNLTGNNGYLVAIGSAPGLNDISNWQVTPKNSTSFKMINTQLQSGRFYFITIRAIDDNGNSGPAGSGDGWQNLKCPDQWIKIFGNATPGLGGSIYANGTKTNLDGSEREIEDFCTMKYEAKLNDPDNRFGLGAGVIVNGNFDNSLSYSGSMTNVGPVSTASGKPWVNISRKNALVNMDAERACTSLGENFKLMNNAQWQAIARDIESLASNWNANSSLDTSYLSSGHSDSNPSEPCDAVHVYVEGDCATPDGGSPFFQKRTQNLTSGEVIWDFAGNAREWLVDARPDTVNDPSNDGFGSTDWMVIEPFIDEEGPTGSNKLMFYTNLNHTGKIPGNGNSQRGGLGIMDAGVSNGNAYLRGGSFTATNAGIYYLFLGANAINFHDEFGFRCVYAP